MRTEEEIKNQINELKKHREVYQTQKNDIMGITITSTIHGLEWVLNADKRD